MNWARGAWAARRSPAVLRMEPAHELARGESGPQGAARCAVPPGDVFRLLHDADLPVGGAQVDQRAAIADGALDMMLADFAAQAHFEIGGDRRIAGPGRQ